MLFGFYIARPRPAKNGGVDGLSLQKGGGGSQEPPDWTPPPPERAPVTGPPKATQEHPRFPWMWAGGGVTTRQKGGRGGGGVGRGLEGEGGTYLQ